MNERHDTIIRGVIATLHLLLDGPGPRPKPQPQPRPALRIERVQEFLRSQAETCDQKVPAQFVWQRFVKWLPEDERDAWNRVRLYRELRKSLKIKNGTANKLYVHGILLRMGGGLGI